MEEERTTTSTSPSILPDLPEEWVGCRDLCSLATSSHWGHRVAHDDHLWRELFKRDRRKLPYLTDLCFAASPTWREYYKHRFTTDRESWEYSSHQLQLWDGSYNPSASSHARDAASAGSLRVRPGSEERTLPPTYRIPSSERSSEAEEDEEEDGSGTTSGGEEEEESEGTETETEGEESGRTDKSDDGEKADSNREEDEEGESEEERREEAERRRRAKDDNLIKAQMIMTRRKRRMISRSTPASTVTSPRRRQTEERSPVVPFQPPLPFIPYSPPVFPQAKRKAVAFIGPRGAGKATMFYLLKFGRMFRGTRHPSLMQSRVAKAGVRYLRKFGGIVSLDISHLHCHLELEVWDITTEGNLDINQKIVPFYQLHGVIIIVDGSSLCPNKSSVIRDILQRILNTPPACQTSIRKDSTAVVDYAWLFPPPVLVYANKCDLQPHTNAFDVATMLDLNGVLGMREAGSPLQKKSGRWRVQSCSAMDGRGVIPGIQWLHESMQVNN